MHFTKKKNFHIKNIFLPREWLTYTLILFPGRRQRLHGVGLRFRFGAKSRYELKYFAFT